jgi:hypothetical protein
MKKLRWIQLGMIVGVVLIAAGVFGLVQQKKDKAEELQEWIAENVYPVLKIRNLLTTQCTLQWELGHLREVGGRWEPGVAPDDVKARCASDAAKAAPLPVYTDSNNE